MKKIKIIEIPRPLYTYKNSDSNRNYILSSGFVKTFLFNTTAESSIEIMPQNKIEFGGDAFLLNELKRDNPSILIFPSVWDYNFQRSSYLAKKIKDSNPNIKIIAGGSQISTRNPSQALEFPFDFGVNKGITPMVIKNIILEIINNKKTLNENNQRKIFLPEKLSLTNIENLPSPYLKGYLDSSLIYNKAPIQSKMNCTGKCLYCCGCVYESKYEIFRNFEDIKKELLFFREKGVKEVLWFDSTINTPFEWFKKLCDFILKEKLNDYMDFHANIRADHLNKEEHLLLKTCNFKNLNIGLQTINEEILKKLNRKTNLKKWLKNIHALNNDGFNLSIDVLLGLPYDNINSFEKTMGFLMEENLITKAMVYLLRNEPTSNLYKIINDENMIFQKSQPHLILNSSGFSFEDLKKGISFSTQNGAEIRLLPYKNDTHPLFTSNHSNNINNTNELPITKIIFDTNSSLFSSDKLLKHINIWKEKLASSMVIWFKGINIEEKQVLIIDIFRDFSNSNPFNIWNIIIEPQEKIKPNLLDKIRENISFLPNTLDYESIYYKDNFELEFHRTTTRLYLLLSEPLNFREKQLEYLSSKAYIIGDMGNKIINQAFDLPYLGFLFNFEKNVTEKEITQKMSEIYKLNWRKKKILFRNIDHQTIYDSIFLNKKAPEGYEENIIELTKNVVTA